MKKTAVMIFMALAMIVSLAGCTDKISGAEHYDKAHYVTAYKGDLDSDLSVFPDTLDGAAQVNVFESAMATGLFDTDGYLVLDCSYTPERLAAEVERLKGLSKTITHYDGQTFTNTVVYDDDSYHYPAYVTNDGFGHTHEYALIDEAGGRIVYVYTAYINPKKFAYPDYLKKDLSAYEQDSTDSFTMYNHTFDGGQSWDEFDDLPSVSGSGNHR